MKKLEISNLKVSFNSVPVLHGINLSIARGESIGIVGESGCGKSLTWLAALRLTPSKAKLSGEVRLDGGENIITSAIPYVEKIRGGRIAMIFQDPSSALNPVKTVGQQIKEAVILHRKLNKKQAKEEVLALMNRVGIPDAKARFDSYPHQFSGGQNQRLMIAMALAGAPDILIADEPTTALDATIQAQILDLLNELRRERNMGLVFISHDLGAVSQICDRICVMYAGRIVEDSPTNSLFYRPRHPYTHGLFTSIPPFDGTRKRLVPIEGRVPEFQDNIKGCAFYPRCQFSLVCCNDEVPPLHTDCSDRLRSVACFNPKTHNVSAKKQNNNILLNSDMTPNAPIGF
ncbi:ABC transporter ATP-binding protein [Bartonella tamiae]|uniref:Oligopeptide/dipeptide ABC transporter, ATP-binding protein domain n=1 Tax=Bartonella tamiae Th239 TaxID=1094558 RepID=J0R171_9HYPH|nr:ABC transporter ATP-binding protein [Bartonella tamiae]EJF89294.1 oligopeptide/dipeptide ABC transporter, ATP-binding protein domain [Bartonella tamiae Th239]EJF95544.1 oligopeptide/dipeptide ABC transporter, ATP-binding protein domain [Bartonella tamiae Th307]